MAVYRLAEQLIFPSPQLAAPEGLLAVGGDLSPARLLLAYSSGIFPWYNPGEPILWWSPDPRCILDPATLQVSHSLAKALRRHRFTVTFDQDFPAVIAACVAVRREAGEGTWISDDLEQAYLRLYRLGYAHSVECWQQQELVGGLYGVCLGHWFFGESMFHRASNASKIALATLCDRMKRSGRAMIDCQLANPHLLRLGAREIPRREFLQRLQCGAVTPSTSPPAGPFPGS